jgi:hypothetical protein
MVLFGIQNRTLGSYLAAIHRIVISAMKTWVLSIYASIHRPGSRIGGSQWGHVHCDTSAHQYHSGRLLSKRTTSHSAPLLRVEVGIGWPT